MSDLQRLPAPQHIDRVETGAVQFGNDWPGVFIRGDNAIMGYLPWLRGIHARFADEMDCWHRLNLESLMRLLESCDERTDALQALADQAQELDMGDGDE